jgi:PIN domain nuclease of toxin-antitoxin system
VNVLLDTNALLWWLADSDRLGQPARAVLADPSNTVYVSAASAWEIAIKVGLGRLEAPRHVAGWLPDALTANRFTPLPITIKHALGVEELPPYHADPFDRLIISQAIAEDLRVVTGDRQLGLYDIRMIPC